MHHPMLKLGGADAAFPTAHAQPALHSANVVSMLAPVQPGLPLMMQFRAAAVSWRASWRASWPFTLTHIASTADAALFAGSV